MSEEMKEYKIKLIETIQFGNYYVFDFEKPEGLNFTEGQYGIFMHVDKQIEGRKMRAFSMASSMNEGYLRIATRIIEEPSDFKLKMKELKIGEVMSYTGPTGKFTLEESSSAVFIAGGIGITPIRGLLNGILYNKIDIDVSLIYSENDGVYPFKQELDTIKMKSYYQTTPSETIDVVKQVANEKGNDGYYYISGSPGFVNGIQNLLLDEGIFKEQIKFDLFSGYETIIKI